MTWPLVSLELLFIYCWKKVAAAKAALSLLICLFSSHKKMVTATKYPDASNRRQIFSRLDQNRRWKLGQWTTFFLYCQWPKSYFFRNKTFLFYKLEKWNLQHLFEKELRETSQNFNSNQTTDRKNRYNNYLNVSKCAKRDPKDGICCPNFQWRFW